MKSPAKDDLGTITFSPDERWIEMGPPSGRRRIAFHDYSAIYAVPGLYERVFIDELGMRSTFEVVRLFGEALERLGRDPAAERVLDLGAGNGVGGHELRELGVGYVVAVDREPAALTAAARDRPGVYEDYLVVDMRTDSRQLASHGLTAVVALSAIGVGHVPVEALRKTLALLPPGGLYAFAVKPDLLPGSEDELGRTTGYPEYLAELLAGTDLLVREEYVHRRSANGTPHDAVAFVGRV